MSGTPSDPCGETSSSGTRKSARAKKAPQKYDDEYVLSSHESALPMPPAKQTSRPKRKAAEVAAQTTLKEDVAVVQEEAFARMNDDERKEYQGWVELESEPAFFNALLKALGTRDLKVQEVFGLDDMIMSCLPKPVYGLIFLFPWVEEDESSEGRQECPGNLWFNNQVTANSCATVAITNVIFNARNVDLGTKLQEFQEQNRTLPPSHKGHSLNKNDFIRAIHNSVARRSDLLSEDLLLDNKWEAARKKKRARKPAGTKSSSSRRKKAEDETFHYIAFVPVESQVWELDGFEEKPKCLGPYKEDGWLGVASLAIQERMARDENAMLSFNLLAICQSPLANIAESIASNLASVHHFDTLYSGNPAWTIPSPWTSNTPDHLTTFGLSKENIVRKELPGAITSKMGDAGFDLAAAQTLAGELAEERATLEAEYAAELATVDEAMGMVLGRQRDYTPALHQWLRILAERGTLRDMIIETDRAL
ncbi:cysteine proteinase [Xylariaceae sp. FL0016]|nr:cysteine proteinase [Xylariaceae sp. FL0016]